jgi:solute carrier family 25 2-oxodicarboxylate transporter 21
MVKTRFQLNSGVNPSVYSYMSNVIKEEGFFRFYRGLGAEVVGMIPKSSAMYGSYEIFRRMIAEHVIPDQTTSLSSALTCFLAGACAGVPEATVVTPFQVIKVRLQSKLFLGKYTNTMDCAKNIILEEGLFALMNGVFPTIIRNSVWNAVYFGSMQYLKEISSQVFKSSSSPSSSSSSNRSFVMDRVETLITGFAGAVLATCFNAPFDVVKSRFQQQANLPNSTEIPKYRSICQTLNVILKEEGIMACYKGFAPKAIRMGLGGSIAMFSFELICHFGSELQ